jgi:hypothetical protein
MMNTMCIDDEIKHLQVKLPAGLKAACEMLARANGTSGGLGS